MTAQDALAAAIAATPPTMNLTPLTLPTDPDWLAMRLALWPDTPPAEHLDEMAGLLREPNRYFQCMARDDRGAGLGFVEASLRTDPVAGSRLQPVAFVEGLYVQPQARRRGLARSLVEAVAGWAKSRGLAELASDADLRNGTSHAVLRSLGFAETARVVCFNKRLD